MHKSLVFVLIAALAGAAHADPAAKKALVAKVIQLQQPGIESVGRGIVEQSALRFGQQAAMAVQSRVEPDKRQAVAKEIQADIRKYIDESVPLVRERALKIAPATIGPLLEAEFSEAELRELVAMMESPVNRKFLQFGVQMQRVLGEKLVEDFRPLLEPKLKALDQSIAGRLGIVAPAGGDKATNGGARKSP